MKIESKTVVEFLDMLSEKLKNREKFFNEQIEDLVEINVEYYIEDIKRFVEFQAKLEVEVMFWEYCCDRIKNKKDLSGDSKDFLG